ncbi:MAG: phosphatase PAP2 family protein [Leeuwenhoekiella sp.]
MFLLLLFVLLALKFYGQDQVEPNNKFIEHSGDVLAIAIPVSAFVTTLVLKDKKGSWQFAESAAINLAATYALKYTINKPRQDNNGHQGFPSGHTSTAFQGASFIHRRYGFIYSIPAYALAGFTAFSRLDAEKHDGYDILAGALVGIGSTLLFTSPYEQEHMELSFAKGEGSYLLGFKYKF